MTFIHQSLPFTSSYAENSGCCQQTDVCVHPLHCDSVPSAAFCSSFFFLLYVATNIWTVSVSEFQTGEGEAALGAAWMLNTYAQHINAKNTAMPSDCWISILIVFFPF